MELYAAMFVLGFLAAIGLLLYKLYNCMLVGKAYEFPGIVITFLGYFLAWLVCFVVWMQDPEEMLFANLMYLLNWLILVNVMLSFVEGLILAKSKTVDRTVQPYNSSASDGLPYFPGK